MRIILPGPIRCDQCGFNAERAEFPVHNEQLTCPKCGADESALIFPKLLQLVCPDHGIRYTEPLKQIHRTIDHKCLKLVFFAQDHPLPEWITYDFCAKNLSHHVVRAES